MGEPRVVTAFRCPNASFLTKMRRFFKTDFRVTARRVGGTLAFPRWCGHECTHSVPSPNTPTDYIKFTQFFMVCIARVDLSTCAARIHGFASSVYSDRNWT